MDLVHHDVVVYSDSMSDIDTLASVHYTDMKPLVNSYIQKLVQTKWDVSVHGRDLLSFETNTGATEEVPAPNQNWRGCNHPTSNWPYQGHQIPYLIPRTADWLSSQWSNWPLTICCLSVHCYRNVVMNTSQSTHWMLSSRQFLRLT